MPVFTNPCKVLATTAFALLSALASADDVDLAASCGECHALAAPAPGATAADARLAEQAPPLWYAGNKFRQEWLEVWLQDPQRIRPAGHVPARHTINTGTGDEIDAGALPEHPAFQADEARRFATALMRLRPHDALVEAEDYTPGSVAMRMGTMDFRRFKGCIGCHRDREETGGVSGPELAGAWHRLQPEYLVSYIRDPRAWDPAATMPAPGLNDRAIHNLVNYLRVIAEE